LSIGIEDPQDLLADLDAALGAAAPAGGPARPPAAADGRGTVP
jgi:hypothetical protein